jgi:hypothetical protein
MSPVWSRSSGWNERTNKNTPQKRQPLPGQWRGVLPNGCIEPHIQILLCIVGRLGFTSFDPLNDTLEFERFFFFWEQKVNRPFNSGVQSFVHSRAVPTMRRRERIFFFLAFNIIFFLFFLFRIGKTI